MWTIRSIGTSVGVRRIARRIASLVLDVDVAATAARPGSSRLLAVDERMTRDLRAASMRPRASARGFSRPLPLPPNTCTDYGEQQRRQNVARARLARWVDQGRFWFSTGCETSTDCVAAAFRWPVERQPATGFSPRAKSMKEVGLLPYTG